jgi:hypothetical protein
MDTREVKQDEYTVMVTGIAMPDGYGDEAYLENLLRTLKIFLEENKLSHIKVIIFLACFLDKKPKLIEIMQTHRLLSKETKLGDDCFIIQEKNPDVFLMAHVRDDFTKDENPSYSENEHDELRKSPVFLQKLKNVKLILNISNSGMLEIFKDEYYGYQKIFATPPRIVHFPEHGCKLDPKEYVGYFHKQYPMGFKEGMFFAVPEKRTKREVLLSIQDKKLLSLLLNESSEQKQEAAIQNFEQNVQFFPGYYKYSLYLYLLTFVKAPITRESNKIEITVFGSAFYGARQDYLHDLDYLKFLYQAGINKLEIVTDDKKEIIDLSAILMARNRIPKTGTSKHKKFKTLRMIDTWVSGDDFARLYELADDLAGCSGDKSLEAACANLCVMLYEMRSYKVEGFREDILDALKETLFETLLIDVTRKNFGYNTYEADCIWHKFADPKSPDGAPIIQLLTTAQLISLAEQIAPHLTKEKIAEAKKILREIVQNKNLYQLLPTIFAVELKAALTVHNSYVPLSFLNSPRKTSEQTPNLLPQAAIQQSPTYHST